MGGVDLSCASDREKALLAQALAAEPAAVQMLLAAIREQREHGASEAIDPRPVLTTALPDSREAAKNAKKEI